MGGRLTRRKVLKTIGASGALVGGIAAIGQTRAWEEVPIDLRCLSCDRLGKIDGVNEGPTVDDEWGFPGSVDGSTFSFDTDGDGVEESIIDITEWYPKEEEDENTGLDFVTNGVGICRVDIKGAASTSSGVREYTDLGAAVRGTDFFAPDANGDGTPDAISNIEFYYCPTVRVCVLSNEVPFDPAKEISVASDEVRLAVWWGAHHFSDKYLFENGAAPNDERIIGDKDGDGTDDLCFDFTLKDAIVDNPLTVKNPDRMKLSLLVRETDEDNDLFVGHTQEGLVVQAP